MSIGAASAASASARPDGQIAQVDQQNVDAIDGYVREYGVSVSEARDRLHLQTELDAPIAAIVEDAGARVAGFEVQHFPEFSGVVYLAGDAP